MNVPSDLKYSKSHEWVRVETDEAKVGITDFAQKQLGDLVYVELPKVGQKLKLEAGCAVVESVKAASDIYAPISGTVTAINTELSKDSGLVNRDPYGSGWFFKVKIENAEEISKLLSAKEYQDLVGSEA